MQVTGQRCDLPRITVVTPCLNGARYIAEAIESVSRQDYPDYEHIIVDGASTDGTLALLREYARLAVFSEPDRGSHDAMNKGVARATGEIVGFLNVDDSYPEGTLLTVGAAFARHPEAEVVVGDTVVYEDTADRRAVRFIFKHPQGIWLPECLFGNPGLNGCFFRRSVFEKIGPFDNKFHISADRDFLVRAALADVRSIDLNATTLWCRAHDGSQTNNRSRTSILKIAGELFDMASCSLDPQRTPPLPRSLARAWQAFEGARLGFVLARHGRLAAAAGVLARLTRQSPLWPVLLARAMVLRRAARRDYRGGWNEDLSAEAGAEALELSAQASGPDGHRIARAP